VVFQGFAGYQGLGALDGVLDRVLRFVLCLGHGDFQCTIGFDLLRVMMIVLLYSGVVGCTSCCVSAYVV
jgi:hypothetical protein